MAIAITLNVTIFIFEITLLKGKDVSVLYRTEAYGNELD